MGKFIVESGVGKSSDSSNLLRKNEELEMDMYYGPQLPPNILFPDQLNKYLKEQIQNLTLENGSLRRHLEEVQEELTSVKNKTSKVNLPVGGRASEIAANKIAELSKKIREQNAELEVLKTRAKDAEAKLRQLESKEIDFQSTPPPPSEDEISEKEKQIKSLTEKLQSANSKMCDLRNQCQALRQELKLAQKVIENEVGERVVLQELAKEGGSWRGRAQQIISLQNKVQHLQEQLNNTNVADIPAVNLLRQMERDRRASYEETNKQLNQKTIQMEDLRKKLEAAKARNKVLENEIIQIKNKMSLLMDKGAKDEQLVASLTNQINAIEDRGKAQIQCFTKMQDNIYKLQQEIDVERQKNEHLQKALADRENRMRKLEDQIEGLKKKNMTVEDFSNSVQKTDWSESNLLPSEQITEKRALTIVDSERLRLLELLTVVNRRLDETRKDKTEVENQLRREKYKNARMETKIARLELEKVGALKTGRGSYSKIEKQDTSLEESDLMQTKQQIEYLEEECLALKTKLELLQMEREEDLKMFTAITEKREEMFEKTSTTYSNSRKLKSSLNSPRNPGALPSRRTKHAQNKHMRLSSGRFSMTGQSSFSSEDSMTQ